MCNLTACKNNKKEKKISHEVYLRFLILCLLIHSTN